MSKTISGIYMATQLREFLSGDLRLLAGTKCSVCGEVIAVGARYFRFPIDDSLTCERCVDKKKNKIRREHRAKS